MLIVADRVKETTTTVGAGNLTLLGASQGFRSFSSVLGSNDVCYYTIQGRSTDWEVGLGTFVTPSTLQRTTIIASSNAGAAVVLQNGTKDVFLTSPARSVFGGSLTPPDLLAIENDYAPTNIGKVNVLRLSSTIDSQITGISDGTPGRLLVIENIGAFNITLADQNVGSLLANQFIIGNDIQIIPMSSVLLHYDEISGGWRALGGGGGGTFTNPNPCTISVGGIAAGSTFNNQSLSDMMNTMLYPYQAPSFGSFGIIGQSSPIEVGTTISAGVTFTWSTSQSGNVAPNTVAITDTTRSETLTTGHANDGTFSTTLSSAITKTTATSHSFGISAQNTQSGNFSRAYTVTWLWRRRYGTNVNPTLTAGDIAALASSGLASGYAGSYAFAAGGYKFIVFPDAAGGSIASAKDNLTGFNVPFTNASPYTNVDAGGFNYALVSGTNANGVAVNFRVYRTSNALGGSITLVLA